MSVCKNLRDTLVPVEHRTTLRTDNRDMDNRVARSHYKMLGANKARTNLSDMNKCKDKYWAEGNGFFVCTSHNVLGDRQIILTKR